MIHPGTPVAVDRLVQRLALSGYASVRDRPARPGQYRRTGERLELSAPLPADLRKFLDRIREAARHAEAI